MIKRNFLDSEQTVAIIIVNYNQSFYTIQCIRSILNSTYSNYKIILIENGSRPEELNILEKGLTIDKRFYFFKQKKNLGYVGGVNVGFFEGSKFYPEYYMVMNNDTVLDPNGIDELIKASLKYNNRAIVTGKVLDYENSSTIQFVGAKLIDKRSLKYEYLGVGETDDGQFSTPAQRDMIDDIFWLFHSDLYGLIGGYSPHFWFNGESADFVLRAKAQGYKTLYWPYAKIWHKGSPSVGGKDRNPVKTYWIVQSRLILRQKHLKTRWFIVILVKYFLKLSVSLFGSIYRYITRKPAYWNNFLAKVLAYLYVLRWCVIKNINTGKNPFQQP